MTSCNRAVQFVTSAVLVAILLTSVSCATVGGLVDEAKDQLNQVKDEIPLPHDSHERPVQPTGTILMGPALVIASQVVEPSGGSVTVRKPGDPLDGLDLTVPEGAYPNAKQVNISTAPVTNHTFGEYFNPVTPVIIIENGGEYSDKLMVLRIPVDVPP